MQEFLRFVNSANNAFVWLAAQVHWLLVIVPLGWLGMVRWGMWLVKRFIALFYRPVRNDYDTTATIVTPVYKEDPVLFRKAVDSWLANGPDMILIVVDVSDKVCIAIAHEYAAQHTHVRVIEIAEPGKRPALARGVDLTTTDLVVLVDSDVIWDPDVLKKLKMPFVNPRIGGVGTRQNMYPSDAVRATFWERIADIYLDLRYTDDIRPGVVIEQAISCLSGRTAAYRTKLLQELREPFLNETFAGRRCMSGDDKCYTMLVLQSGYLTQCQINARVYSTFKPTFDGFLKQRVRWARNSWRSDSKALWQGWVWRHPFLAIMLIERALSPFLLLVGPITLGVSLILGRWQVVLALLIWWTASRGIKLAVHFVRRPGDIWLLPFYLPLTWFMSFVRMYALATINTHQWLTRPVAMVNGEAVRL